MSQAVHEEMPDEGPYEPAKHNEHDDDPDKGLKEPITHGVHSIVPLVAVYLPGAHSKQADWEVASL